MKITLDNFEKNSRELYDLVVELKDLALLVASIPELKGLAVKPYRESGISKAGKTTTYYLLCKGKRKLEKDKDDIKLEKYVLEFEEMVEMYREVRSKEA